MENRGLVDLKELRENILNADFRGKSAYCFIKGNKIIKVYATKDNYGYFPLNFDDICDFSGYKADTIVFPDEYIYENGKIVGEILDYIRDSSITKEFKDSTSIDNIIENYELVINDLVTYSNIQMIDLCPVNILYSEKNGFHIIDTTEWKLGTDRSKINIHSFSGQILRVLFDKIALQINYRRTYAFVDNQITKNCNKYGKVGKAFNNVLEMNVNNSYHFIELMFLYKRLYEMHYGKELSNIKEMKEFTKILKKG